MSTRFGELAGIARTLELVSRPNSKAAPSCLILGALIMAWEAMEESGLQSSAPGYSRKNVLVMQARRLAV
jgi:hypothetical protein